MLNRERQWRNGLTTLFRLTHTPRSIFFSEHDVDRGMFSRVSSLLPGQRFGQQGAVANRVRTHNQRVALDIDSHETWHQQTFERWRDWNGRYVWLYFVFELEHDKTNTITYAPSEDSDQPGHPPSLITVDQSLGCPTWGMFWSLAKP